MPSDMLKDCVCRNFRARAARPKGATEFIGSYAKQKGPGTGESRKQLLMWC